MTLAPAPMFPEKHLPQYEVGLAQNLPRRGPLRFEEGVATDTDIPSGFTQGMGDSYAYVPGRANSKPPVYYKYPQETMAQRAHMGSASWIEGPVFLGEFAAGTGDGATVVYEETWASGGRYERQNPATVIG